MNDQIIGYVAASTTIVALGTQFVHTVRSNTIEGVSLSRCVLDTVSLALWVLYATRIDDNPLLIATGCELFLSLCVCVLVLKYHMSTKIILGCTINIHNANHIQINVAHKTPQLSYAIEMPQAKSCEQTENPMT
jgi:uncharacterized protein with PQ loop repeat